MRNEYERVIVQRIADRIFGHPLSLGSEAWWAEQLVSGAESPESVEQSLRRVQSLEGRNYRDSPVGTAVVGRLAADSVADS